MFAASSHAFSPTEARQLSPLPLVPTRSLGARAHAVATALPDRITAPAGLPQEEPKGVVDEVVKLVMGSIKSEALAPLLAEHFGTTAAAADRRRRPPLDAHARYLRLQLRGGRGFVEHLTEHDLQVEELALDSEAGL
jgi:hypothetical protein